MTSISISILAARSSDDHWFKLLFGAIMVVLWVGGAILSAIKKRMEENKGRQQYGRMAGPVAMPAPPPVPRVPPRKIAKPQVHRQRVVAPPLPPQARVAVAAPPVRIAAATASAEPRRAAGGAGVAPPNQIARLLRRPDSLRAALILNEVLGPPLSIRDGREAGAKVI
jgi:hypothetical protein